MTEIKVISYNILSPNLVSAHSTERDPRYLEEEYRFDLVQEELRDFISDSDYNRPIFALQEVAQSWADKLLVFFEQFGYRFYWSRGSKYFNGYMGVAIAWPANQYEIVQMKTVTPSEDIPKPPKDDKEKYNYSLNSLWYKLNKWWYGSSLPKNERHKLISDWKYASYRNNTALLATFMHTKFNQGTFLVANYHMPCAFKKPLVMLLHAAALSRKVLMEQTTIDHHNLPIILVGDFNSQPDSTVYRYLTNNLEHTQKLFGELDIDINNSQYQDFYKLYEFIRDSRYNFRSAYLPEPNFTNRAIIQFGESDPYKFEGCLDYIFINELCETIDTLPVPTADDLPSPKYLPTIDFPSDHLPIGATLRLSLKNSFRYPMSTFTT